MDAKQFAAASGLSEPKAALWLPHVEKAAAKYDFTKPARMAMWIAQCGHESAGFLRLVENLNYSAEGLQKTWPTRFPTPELAELYARQPVLIANRVYANRLGNGDEASGDGWRYRGRGLIQITGRANYAACGHGLGLDLLGFPGLLEGVQQAADSAGWFWEARDLNEPTDRGDILAVTKKINGGTHGLVDRKKRWERAKVALGLAAAA